MKQLVSQLWELIYAVALTIEVRVGSVSIAVVEQIATLRCPHELTELWDVRVI
jgi:hypothetical protein